MFIFAESASVSVLPSPQSLLQFVKIPSATRVLLSPQKQKTGCAIRSLQRGQRSYFLIGHLQELGVYISGTLPFLVEQELVITAVSTNGCVLKGEKLSAKSDTYRKVTLKVQLIWTIWMQVTILITRVLVLSVAYVGTRWHYTRGAQSNVSFLVIQDNPQT